MGKIKRFINFVDRKVDIRKFLKFGITGVLNTGVNYVVSVFCKEILKIDPKMCEIPAYIVASVNSYLINKNWTFQKKKGYNKAEIIKFAFVNTLSMGLSYLGVYVFHDLLGINYYAAKIPVMFITIAINYFGNKIFVFNK